MCRQGILICRRGWAPLTSALTTCTALSYTLYRYTIDTLFRCTIYTIDTLYTIDILYRYTIDTLFRYTIYTTDTLYTIDILYRYTIDTQHAPHCSAFRQSIGPHFRDT